MNINLETMLLENEELKFLSEFTPYAEGSGLADFMDEAKHVAAYMERLAGKVRAPQAKLLAIMRGFYLLGVLRGGAEYRSEVISKLEVEIPDLSVKEYEDPVFDPDDECAADFAWDINQLTEQELEQVCKKIGLPAALCMPQKHQ